MRKEKLPMITENNLKQVLEYLEFTAEGEIYTKNFDSFDCLLKIDFKKEEIIYPEEKGLIINQKQTCNFSSNENFVVLECVNRLLEKGYNPAHIELEPTWQVGHGASGGRADILVKDNQKKPLLIIECKNAGSEFTKHWNETLENGSQLFGYAQQERKASFLCLYASDFIDGEVKPSYRLITLKDNKQYLEDNPKLKSFKDAKDREELFQVWKNTYQKDFTTKGLFEKDIQPYNIGKKKYSVADLSLVDNATKQSKHHDFATILRKYNVSGRENAFDKLVNLFLCKIVDEKNNPNDLQFYWKGIAHDTPFELQDRLQKLYKIGMDEFLKEDVTYIDNQQIDQAFWTFKNDPDATKETIKDYFRQLKFFTNNDFAFIDVHNERLFYENSKVLIDIVRLFQDTEIKSDSKNQFLGDMFENFLDSGVKQSEGQFFTPMPITRFIIQSLPLENIVNNDTQQAPKAIDYACGSGHFLNELASQMQPFIEANKQINLEEYHKSIHGIEKEYRLSKVAKVSAFMYGQEHIDITYTDALAKNEKFKPKEYQILVANPPYSVKGFLSTLDQESKDNYELIETIDSKQISTNNSIECFFIERAKQLLAGNGVAAIIVPSSILSNSDSTYTATRAILLKHFDIVAIVEFGSGTFGKTGTNTVTLFLRRKSNQPEQADHYKNRVESWFSDDNKEIENEDTSEKFTKQGIFEDEHFIQSYCHHVNIDFTDYKTLLAANPNEELLKTEIFTAYKETFNEQPSIKNKKKQHSFIKLLQDKQQEELDALFLKYITKIEKEKLYYFVLASNNPTDVVIVKAPNDGKENKRFLGYEWSGRKGDEGIKLNKDANGKHITPLYDEDNRYNTEKINQLITQSFNNETVNIPEVLNEYVSLSPLNNMLDFTRTDFTKQLSLTPKKMVNIETKWDLVKLGEATKLYQPKTITSKDIKEIGKHKVFGANGIIGYYDKYNHENEEIVITCRGATCGTINMTEKQSWITGNAMVAQPIQSILKKYLFEVLNYIDLSIAITGTAQPQITRENLSPIKIPLPSLGIQQQIVAECHAIDTEKEQAERTIKKAKESIENGFKDTFSRADKMFKLSNSDDFEVFIGKRVLKNEIDNPNGIIPIYSANVFEPFGEIDKLFIEDFTQPSVLWGIDGDWMVNYIPANSQFYPTDHCGVIRVKTKEVNPRYLAWVLNEAGKEKRFSRSHRASTDRIKGISIKFPDIKIQNELEKEIIKQEATISRSKEVLATISERKQAVLNAYL